MRTRRASIKKIIEDYKKSLLELGITVEETILYGSFAKGNERCDSDIDLIVISRDFKKMNLRERIEVLGIAAVRIMQPIEARGYTLKEVKTAPAASLLSEIVSTV